MGTLLGPAGEVRLRPQTFSLLEVLVENAPRILSSDDLIDQGWDVDYVSVTTIRQGISELRQALGDSASEPRIIETVHRRGYRLIATVEQLAEPSAEELAAEASSYSPGEATSGGTEAAAAAALAAEPSGRPKIWTGARYLALLFTTVLVGLQGLLPNEPESLGTVTQTDTQMDTQAVALVELSNFTGDPSLDWVAAAMGEMLESRLAIEGFQTLRVAADTPEVPRSAVSKDAPERVLRGSYSVLDSGSASELYFLVRIEDRASQQAIDWAHEAGRVEELPALAEGLGRSVLGILDHGSATEDRRIAVQKMLASSSKSLRLFEQALEALRESDCQEARPKLEDALELDPDNPLLHETLAEVYDDLGFDHLAAESARQAEVLAAGLSWEVRSSAQARVAEVRRLWPRAEQRLHPLCQRFPLDPAYCLRLAKALFHQGRLDESLSTLRRSDGADQRPRTRLAQVAEIKILMALNRLDEAEVIARGLQDQTLGEAPSRVAFSTQYGLLGIHLRRGELAE
ncbi:MAG: winged helix-turn-helix domain-containing protein, partial [Acidobacteriota bacterium]